MITDTRTARRFGLDFGGTQASFLASPTSEVKALPVDHFRSMEDAVRYIVTGFGAPKVLMIGAAGHVEKDCVKLTNRPSWPEFHPETLGKKLGFTIIVVNDMIIKAAGLRSATVKTLHAGRAVAGATKTVVTVSSGVGNAQELPNGTLVDSEGGHTSWQPLGELLMNLLLSLQRDSLQLFSVEELIGGAFPHVFRLYDALMDCGYQLPSWDRREGLEACRASKSAIGPFLTKWAIEENDLFCTFFMEALGSLLGQYLRNLALVTKPQAGIYLTGGVMQPSVVNYLFEKPHLRANFLAGSTHNDWLEQIPIHLVTDPHLGVKGAALMAARAS